MTNPRHKINKIMAQQQLTRVDLMNKSNVSFSVIRCCVEQNYYYPTLKNALKLSKALGVPVENIWSVD